MPIDIIKWAGICIDIEVPKEHAEFFIQRIEKDPGCHLDKKNCIPKGEKYQIRILCQVRGQGAIFSLIRDLTKESGIDEA